MKFARQKTFFEEFADKFSFLQSLNLLFPILIVFVLPVTIYLVQHQTQYQQHAAGNLSQFFGVNVDICLLNPNSPNYVKNTQGQDLIDIAGRLGINFFRINDGGCGLSGGPVSASNWGLVLNKMATYNIQAQIVSGMGGGFGTGSISYAVSKVINNKLGSYPNVYGYDLVNEPYIDPPTIAAMLQAKQQIQAVYPNLRITVGGWKTLHGVYNCPATFTGTCWQLPQDGQYLYPVVDYFSPHIYGFDKPLNGPYKDAYTLITNYFDQMLTYTQSKPIIVGEYGASNGYELTDQGTLASPQLQANVTDAMLRAVQVYQNRNALGSAQWAFYNRSLTHGGTPGWDLVYNTGATILPAAYVIQKYSTGRSDIPLTLPMPIISKDYIFTNTDNGKTVAVNQNDIVGLDLTLPANNYTLQVSNLSLFTITESLILGTDGNYKNVLHAANPGTATVNITQTNCSSNCQMFQMTFTINPGNGPTPTPTSQPNISLMPTPTNTPTPTPTSTPTKVLKNILQNPSFETAGLNPWGAQISNDSVATITQDGSTAEDGIYSAKVAITTNNPSMPWSIKLRQDSLTLSSNTLYSISFWAKGSVASSPNPQHIDISLREDKLPNTVYCLVANVAITSSSWQQYTVSCPLKTVVDTSTTTLSIDLAKASGIIWIDNVVLR